MRESKRYSLIANEHINHMRSESITLNVKSCKNSLIKDAISLRDSGDNRDFMIMDNKKRICVFKMVKV